MKDEDRIAKLSTVCHQLRQNLADRDVTIRDQDKLMHVAGHQINVAALAIDSFESEVEKLEVRIEELEADLEMAREAAAISLHALEIREKLDHHACDDRIEKHKARIADLEDELLVEKGRVDEYRARDTDRG